MTANPLKDEASPPATTPVSAFDCEVLKGKSLEEYSASAASSSMASDAETSTDAPVVEVPTDLAINVPGSETDAKFRWRELMFMVGPGFIMVMAYLDPGNLEADLQAGVTTGYTLLWFFLLSTTFGWIVQCLSSRLGVVTGKHLAEHCGNQYRPFTRYTLWLLLEVALIGADVQETIGCAIAIQILSAGTIPLWAGCLLVSASAFCVLMLQQAGARWLESVFGVLVAVEAGAMMANYLQAGPPQDEVLKGVFVPKLPSYAVQTAVGALGAIVMPYNLYFHSWLVNTRDVDKSSDKRKRVVLTYLRIESGFILMLSFIVNLFVVCVFAVGFFNQPQPDTVGLESAGGMLEERFGVSYKYLWAVGLLASGQSATIALTYAGQLIVSGFLRMEICGWKRMVITRSIALIPTIAIAVLQTSTSIFDIVNQILNIVQSLMLPFALIPLIYMTRQKRIMGEQFITNKLLLLITGGITLAVMAINGYLLVQFLQEDMPQNLASYICFPILMALYYAFQINLIIGPKATGKAGTWMKGKAEDAMQYMKSREWKMDPMSMMEVHI